jgi:alpha-tubulin suppressor-like RCC1 family protein
MKYTSGAGATAQRAEIAWSLGKASGLGCLLLLAACAQDARSATDEARVAASANQLCTGVQVGWSPAGPVVSGAVTLSASAGSCALGETEQYRFLYRQEGTGTAFTELQGWSGTPTAPWDTTLTPSGKYSVSVYARAAGSTANYQSRSTKLVLVGDVCPSVTLTASPTGIQAPGTGITFDALASCTGGTAQYRFERRSPGSAVWQELRDWSTTANLSWDTTGQPVGAHGIRVHARAGTNLVIESTRTMTVTLGERCSSLLLSASPTGSQIVDSPVSLSASATCTGSAQPEFQYSYRPSGALTWTVLRPWDAQVAASWDTIGLPAGPYQLRADVRADDYAGASQQGRVLNYTLGSNCGTVTLAASPGSPRPLGTAVTLTASASCAGGTPEYRFSMREPGASADTPLRDWGDAGFVITTEPTLSGLHTLKVEARAVGAAVVQATAVGNFQFGSVCNAVAFSTLLSSPQTVGTSVGLQATATCTGGAAAAYTFDYRHGASGTWLPLQGWSTANTASWTTAALAVGSYQLRVQARGSANLGPAESARTLGFELTAPVDVDGDGVSAANGDCDDDDPDVYPGAPEACNGVDDDCDSVVDDGYTIDAYFEDADGDGYGNPLLWMDSCMAQAGFVANADDCDDTDAGSNPAATDVCGNDIDEDCDGSAPSCAVTMAVSAGTSHTCALRSDGLLYCWGNNRDRQIQETTPSAFATPRLIKHSVWTPSGNQPLSVVKDVHSVATGASHTCVLRRNPSTADGHYVVVPGNQSFLWDCWGEDTSGQAAGSIIGMPTSRGRPEQIVAGSDHTCVRTDLGTVYCWGNNTYGQLGNGNNTGGPTPVQVVTATDALTGVTDLTATYHHTCALSAGKAYCWGSNASYQLGVGPLTDRNVATLVPNVTGTQIATSGTATCVRTNGGTVSCWGSGTSNGSSQSIVAPTTVSVVDTTGTIEVRGGADFMCARKTSGVVCWGSNMYSQLNAVGPVAQASALSVRAGWSHNCAIAAQGVYCWGHNGSGECGVGIYSSSVTTPTLVSSWPTN